MYKNYIFDMGGVLLRYDTRLMSRALAGSDADAEILERALFLSNEWRLADLGNISQETLLSSVLSRIPLRLIPAMTELFRTWHIYMTPLEGASDCLRALKNDGRRLYLLSNASTRFEDISALNPGIFSQFDGMIVSAYEHVIKPDEKIYHTLLERFSLDAGECIFFDDMPRNVYGAKRCSMASSVFNGDFSRILEISRKNT
ncbi:MAG: HAD family phosphatase [Clostridiales bacterium]|nr:HAD family phosphatase [Clostridiales bacterium]